MTETSSTPQIEIADTVRWLERAVIGLNLCPFAKAPHIKGQIHYAVSEAKGLEGLRDELIEQLQEKSEEIIQENFESIDDESEPIKILKDEDLDDGSEE